MKNSMHVAVLLAFAVEYRADGIQHAADEQIRESLFAYRLIRGLGGDDYAPAETDLADHRKFRVLFQINCGEHGRDH